MARPCKAKRVCAKPSVEVFGPLDQETDGKVELTLEEYETIRLIDLLECTQEECAVQMGVARTTVQAVYNTARRKIADCIVQRKGIGDSGRKLPDLPQCSPVLRPERGNANATPAAVKTNSGGCQNENCGNI